MPNRQGVWSLPTQYQAIGDQNWIMAPAAPTGVSATAGNTEATVSFTAPTFTGIPSGITGYRVTSSAGDTATGSSSPITVTGLTNDTAYTFTVQAQNSIDYGPEGGPSGSVTPTLLERILYFGGNEGVGGTAQNVIEYINPSSTGNGTDFGDLWTSANGFGGVGSETRAVMARSATMQYVTFATTGNTSDFGDLNTNNGSMFGSGSNTRGLFVAGGTRAIDYITIASTGDATDFGDIGESSDDPATACSGSTRTAFGKVGTSLGAGTSNTIEYVTTATTGNAADFGDLSGGSRKQNLQGASSSTRGLFAAGYRSYPTTVYYNTIEYITFSSTGDTTDFGDLTQSLDAGSFGSGKTRAVFGGGYTGSTRVNVLQYVTIASTGNATDFGDLTASKSGMGTASSVHGGNYSG